MKRESFINFYTILNHTVLNFFLHYQLFLLRQCYCHLSFMNNLEEKILKESKEKSSLKADFCYEYIISILISGCVGQEVIGEINLYIQAQLYIYMLRHSSLIDILFLSTNIALYIRYNFVKSLSVFFNYSRCIYHTHT